MSNNLSEKLRDLRKLKGITQEELANAIGIKRTTLANFENKGTQPDMNVLNKIADYFYVSVEYLTGATNSLAIPTSVYNDIYKVFNINEVLPMWIRIKNPIDFEGSPTPLYGLTDKSEIEAFHPLEERKEDRRIYLRLVNCLTRNFKQTSYNLFEFTKKYGFWGRIPDALQIKLFNRLPNPPVPRLYLVQSFNKGVKYFCNGNDLPLCAYDLRVNLPSSFMNIKLPEQIVKPYAKTLEEYGIKGYFECPSELMGYASEIKDLIYSLQYRDNQIINIIETINNHLVDIHFRYVTTASGEIVQTFSYTSLFSLVYYELLFDVKNSIHPIRCASCDEVFYILEMPEQTACTKCLTK